MMMSSFTPSLLLLLVTVYSGYRPACGDCSNCADLPSVPAGYKEQTYSESNDHLENPNRGFTMQDSGKASDFTPLDLADLESYREESGLTLHWRQYVLDSFVSSDITTAFLDKIRADMAIVRQAKITVVMRFMYTAVLSESKAPYGDATKDWMLKHIAQLKPIFTEFEDVIDVVQAGFIGVWGEWYYTTHFGDPTADGYDGLTPENWQDRTEVLSALLDAVPNSISVQLRTPTFKRNIFDTVATTETEMKGHTNKSRTGHHNDCFLASSTDYGTYGDKSVEYPYLQDDTKYTVMGGETCAISEDEPKDRYRCPTATKEMSELHFSYINQAYHEGVVGSWKNDGCFGDIHRHVGYRLVLKKAILPNSLEQGGKFCFRLWLENMGYAAPYKQKTMSIMLREKTSGDLLAANLDYDLKTWLPGNAIIIDNAVYVPSDLPTGTYEVLLAFKDKLSPGHSDYNVLLANNDNVPEMKKGLNNLKHDLVVGVAGTAGDSSCPALVAVAAQPESKYSRIYNCKTTSAPATAAAVTTTNSAATTSIAAATTARAELELTSTATTETADEGSTTSLDSASAIPVVNTAIVVVFPVLILVFHVTCF